MAIPMIEQAVADLGYAVRSFKRRPAFAVTAIGCLAVGIAANTLIFSLVNAVLLRALPYPEADRIVTVRFSPPDQPDQKFGSNSGTYFYLREHSSVFERVGAVRITGLTAPADVAGDSAPERIQTAWTTPGLTEVMGVNPILGRWYAQDESSLEVVISHGLWQRMYGGAPEVLGKNLYDDRGTPYEIVGAMPPGYQTQDPYIDLWRLQTDQNLANALRSPNRVFLMFGRLEPGVTLAEAQAELTALESGLRDEYEMNLGWAIRVDSLRDAYVGYLRQPLLVLQGAVFLLLLIACANVGGLLLAQAAARQKEIAMRVALGSGRWRIARQQLTENITLSLAGGAVGVLVAWGGLRTIVGTAFGSNYDLNDASLDWTVLGFTLLISVTTGLAFGVLPALQTSRTDLMDVVRESGRSLTANAARSRLRGAFVVAQVALALVLLIGSGLLIRTLVRLNAVDPGMNPRNLVAVQIPFSYSFYRNTGQNTATGGLLVEFDNRFNQLSERVRERLALVPGVESATATLTPPLGGAPRRVGTPRAGEILTESERQARSSEWYPVSADYFQTLGVPLRRGRAIEIDDREGTPPVAVISESFERQFFPGEDPIGRQIQLDVLNDAPREIVGVVGDVRQDRYQMAPQAQVYVPRTQLPYRMDMTVSFEVLVPSFIVRTRGDASSVIPALRTAVREVDPGLPVASMRTVEDYAAGQLEEVQNYATLLSMFGGISLMLALIGVFGVMAHAVGQRTNEIAVRVALGAEPRNVLGMILGQAFVLIAAGLALGLAASLLLTPVMRSFLWGVSATDPLTFAVAFTWLAFVALAACYLPALRALRVNPVVALKNE